MRIGQLAERAEISTATVRYYESIGLMPEAERTAGGYREYGPEDLERLLFVRDAQTAGLSLTQIGDVLTMKADGESTCGHTAELLRHHLADIDAQVVRLMATRAALQQLVSRAESLDPADCGDPNRCQVIASHAGDAHPHHGGRESLAVTSV